MRDRQVSDRTARAEIGSCAPRFADRAFFFSELFRFTDRVLREQKVLNRRGRDNPGNKDNHLHSTPVQGNN